MILELIKNNGTIQIFADMKFLIMDGLNETGEHRYKLLVRDNFSNDNCIRYELEALPTYNVGGTIVTCREKMSYV